MDQLEYDLRMALAEDDDDDGLEVNDEGCELDALRREELQRLAAADAEVLDQKQTHEGTMEDSLVSAAGNVGPPPPPSPPPPDAEEHKYLEMLGVWTKAYDEGIEVIRFRENALPLPVGGPRHQNMSLIEHDVDDEMGMQKNKNLILSIGTT